jgi:actin cytoskeleton-regulatory complex protein SLA1
VKALYDYEAAAPGELSVKEDDILLAFDQEDDWLLVQSEKDGRAGFVPANCVEVYLEDICISTHYLLCFTLGYWRTSRG